MSMSQARKSPAATGLNQNTSNRHQHTPASNPTQALLARMEGVVQSGAGWRARCPACGGKSRKVSISEGAEGQCLVHCFDCHDTRAIVESIGLRLCDLYQRRAKPDTPQERRQASQAFKLTAWGAALGVLCREAYVVSIAGNDIAKGVVLSADDADRLALALGRITKAREVLT